MSRDYMAEVRAYGIDRARTRLDAKIIRGGENDCWPTTAYAPDGYGRLRCAPVAGFWRTHRLAWVLANGRDPGDLLICHTCDNRACCNPKHLFAGTPLDNMRDMISKGRDRRGEVPRKRAKGPALTADQVREIVGSNLSSREIAVRYGVSMNTAWQIRTGRLWRSVTDPYPARLLNIVPHIPGDTE